jgi:hypothetical protein
MFRPAIAFSRDGFSVEESCGVKLMSLWIDAVLVIDSCEAVGWVRYISILMVPGVDVSGVVWAVDGD